MLLHLDILKNWFFYLDHHLHLDLLVWFIHSFHLFLTLFISSFHSFFSFASSIHSFILLCLKILLTFNIHFTSFYDSIALSSWMIKLHLKSSVWLVHCWCWDTFALQQSCSSCILDQVDAFNVILHSKLYHL